MKRRDLLQAALPTLGSWGGLSAFSPRAFAEAAPAEPLQRLATAWRVGTEVAGSRQRVGVLEVDWAAEEVRLLAEINVPTRPHGLLALPDGGFAAVAARTGQWLLRCDGEGAVVARCDAATETPSRGFNGHVEASADGAWLYTAETDSATQAGWVSVRDAHSLQRVAQFSSGGPDPHQLLRARDGTLMVANGGIRRLANGRKVALDEMSSSLARIDAGSGHVLGQWQLHDPRLSLRHLAWSSGDMPLLGVALQAEHEHAQDRLEAPLLAVWDGRQLGLPCLDARGGGYAGDIAAGPGGGFVLSAQKQRLGLWWDPAQPQRLTRVAELTEPCALVSWPGARGVTLHAARGVARWHAERAPAMLPWPVPMAPDHHAVRLARA